MKNLNKLGLFAVLSSAFMVGCTSPTLSNTGTPSVSPTATPTPSIQPSNTPTPNQSTTPSPSADTSAPALTFTSPAPGDKQVAVNARLAITFTEAMNPLTLTSSSFTVTGPEGSPVTGTVTYAGNVATFTPTNNLAANTTYTATIATGARDLAGNPLSNATSWTFITGTSADSMPPAEIFSNPAGGATSVAVNGKLAVTFSEAMDPLTLTPDSFKVTGPNGTPIAGTVTYAGNVATFTPSQPLAPNTPFTVSLSSGIRDLTGNALPPKTWSFNTGAAGDTAAPQEVYSNPAMGSTGVAVNGKLAVTFTEAMDPLSLTPLTFLLTGPGTTPVAGIISYAGNIMTFTPTSTLAGNTVYTATLTTGIKDLAGNPLANAKTWTFSTSSSSGSSNGSSGGGGGGSTPAPIIDITPPGTSFSNPASGATGIPVNGQIVTTFNEIMDPISLNTLTYTLTGPGGNPIAGTVSFAGNAATFTPNSPLTANTAYTATVTTGAKDLAGNPLAAPVIWTFTTGLVADTVAPTVTLTNPISGAINIPLNASVSATFSEALLPATLTNLSYSMTVPGPGPGFLPTNVPGSVSYASGGTVATFTPTLALTALTTYTMTISTGVSDLANNPLANPRVWSFTTGAALAQGPAAVQLGTAGNFAVLSKSGISTVPNSAITGDIGVSPIALTAITGFSMTLDASNTFATSTQVTGKIYAANITEPTPTNLTTAISDMAIAYTDAAGRVTPNFTNLGAGEIGGQTLVPGLYKWGSGVTISNDVTLNGGPNDVWIFQISGNITQAAGKRVILAGGALPKNIFWQLTGAANLQANTHFEGILLTNTGINLGTGSSINGRMLSQTAVTLDQATVVQPAP